MTKDEFVDMIVKNHSSKQWVSGWFIVDDKHVGVKAYSKFVQRLMYNYELYVSTPTCLTVKTFRAEVYKAFEDLDAVTEAERLKKSRMQTFNNGISNTLNGEWHGH